MFCFQIFIIYIAAFKTVITFMKFNRIFINLEQRAVYTVLYLESSAILKNLTAII